MRLGGVDLSAARLDDVRRQVLVSDTGSGLFAGTLQDAIDPHGRLTREQAEAALRVANAEDVYDALPEGWQGQLDERGRGLSGGQRQRVVLARALAVDAPILVLVEPTSAVDAHTEARIAERVTDLRRGRTTVVCTVSPLWLHHADHVVLLQDGSSSPRASTPTCWRRRCLPHRRGPGARRRRRGGLTMTDVLGTSPATWRDRALDDRPSRRRCAPPDDARWRERNRALWQRHDLRRQRAEDVYTASRNPDRGWPVSGNRAVLAFFRDLLRTPQGHVRRARRAQRSRRRLRARRPPAARRAGQHHRRRRWRWRSTRSPW